MKMPKWTESQIKAIQEKDKNIIVSAGAGSGKTAVLTERVIEKLKSGIKINELLILTFTNAAAGEMKERITLKINDNEDLKDNLDLIESSYITTFDSYTLSLVKKYHYLLNVANDLDIIDDSLLNIIKEDILDEVFEEYYLEENVYFKHLIDTFTVKNDDEIRKGILKIINALDLKSDKEKYLNDYLDYFYSDKKIQELFNEYMHLIYEQMRVIEDNITLIGESEYLSYYEAISKYWDKFLHQKKYDDIKESIPTEKMINRPKNSDDLKGYTANISNAFSIIKNYLRFNSEEEVKNTFYQTKDDVSIIISIITDFYQKLNEYKKNHDLYTFTDVEIMAIDLLKENPNILEEVKYTYKEIMVDEYQDTSDLQEEFISLIENNNVYMVGDIKQSIYRFRNANPMIFKNKYDSYAKNNNGLKIDLLQNFRSRSEVLDSINMIFDRVMYDDIGGANYKKDHQMVFGNMMYSENKDDEQNYALEILNYQGDDYYSKEEIEAFIIGKDIDDKIKNHYQVLDKKGYLRDAKYSDFCIIMDRGNAFDLYKKIFSYLGIPLDIYQNQKLTIQNIVLIINNYLGLIIKIFNNELDDKFRYYFTSIARSFLFSLKDNDILTIINKNIYKETEIYQIGYEISLSLKSRSAYEILKMIIKKANIYEKLILVGDINDSLAIIDNLLNSAKNISKIGYDPFKYAEYLERVVNSNYEIAYKDNMSGNENVKIMNIHKSKGLEFPICYFSGYHKTFNIEDIKDRYLYDNKYGIIVPYFDEGIANTMVMDLLKDKYNKDNISESIRLMYVALTRAKEKMIIVTSLDEEKEYSKNKYNSFLDILMSIKNTLNPFITNIDLKKIPLSKDYLLSINNSKYSAINSDKIEYQTLNIDNREIENKHASKTMNHFITKEEKEALTYGTMMHETFENADFLNLNKSDSNYDRLNSFVKTININEKVKIYKEYEFMYMNNDIKYHGIMDLVLIDDDEVKIIDYKLKNIDDEAYTNQLRIYREYFETLTQKPIKTYLYSIMDNYLKEVITNEEII